MSSAKWSVKFLEKWQTGSIPEEIDEIQRVYRQWMVICLVILAGGVGMTMGSDHPKAIAFGLFLLLTGMIDIALMKLWAHNRLSTLQIIWELRKPKNPSS